MKPIFQLKYTPQYVYISEEQAQKEYQEYLYTCDVMRRKGLTSTCMWLTFDRWRENMEYLIA